MQRRRSAPHTFEENIAAEKAKLEAQISQVKPGPELDALAGKSAVRYRCALRRLAFVTRLATTKSAEPRPQQPELTAPFRVMHAGRGSAMTAERILQVAIFGLFIFSLVLASMLILNS